MRFQSRLVAVSVILGSLVASTCWANIGPPPPEEVAYVVSPVVVKQGAIKHDGLRDTRGIKAKIVIPRGLLPGGGGFGAAPPEEIRDKQSSNLPMGTIIAGIAMSLAVVSSVFLVRKGRGTRLAASTALVAAVVLGAWGALQADIPAPGRGPRPRPEEPRPGTTILIEIVEEGETVTLTLAK